MIRRIAAFVAALMTVSMVVFAPAAVADIVEDAPMCLHDDRGWTCDPVYEGTPDATVRVTGDDRYETSVLLSRLFYPDGAATVFIASGESMVDALPAGATNAGPVLLVRDDRLPDIVSDELERLNPVQVIVLGPVDEGVRNAIIAVTQ
jgi:hypothetical protein